MHWDTWQRFFLTSEKEKVEVVVSVVVWWRLCEKERAGIQDTDTAMGEKPGGGFCITSARHDEIYEFLEQRMRCDCLICELWFCVKLAGCWHLRRNMDPRLS